MRKRTVGASEDVRHQVCAIEYPMR